MSKIDNYWLIQESVYENIKFADTKATSIVALNLAIIAGLYALDIFSKSHIVNFIISCIAFLLLASSIICSVKVLQPRGDGSELPNKKSLCDLHKIKNIESFSEFKKDVSDSSRKDLLNDILLLLYDRSKTNQKKYFWLKWEIRLGAIGWLVSLLSVIVKILF